jgi:hypothetical protein
MKTIFDQTTRNQLHQRIDRLQETNTANWGKMNAGQMVKHFCIWDAWIQGKGNYHYRHAFIGKLFGRMALKTHTKDDRPLPRNMPSGKFFAVKEKVADFHLLKQQWKALLDGYAHFSNDRFVHDFFGKMTREQIGIFVYKHYDHHLRQFGV